ncbi:MAG: PLP-dependent aminotransferase family protein [Filifactoraceae bacterium]
MSVQFSSIMSKLTASEIRELLKLTTRPEIISFAGGLPAPELFPVEAFIEAAKLALQEDGKAALQYSTTEGYEPLRKYIANRMNVKLKTNVTAEDILITNGSQQGLDFSGKILLDKDDVVLCESPSYLGAINAFKSYDCKFIEVPTDENGMIMDELEKIMKTTPNVKMIYVIPDFQNPTGRTWPLERRKKFMEIVNQYNALVVEDNPYGELRFEGENIPSLKSMDTKGNVALLGTFSKTFAPGLRIGWVAASPEVLNKYNVIKQGADLQAATLAQRELAKFLELNDLDKHVETIIGVYKNRRDLMLDSIKKYFPECVKVTYPDGGLFMWATLPEHLDAAEIMKDCLAQNVAYVPGGSFYPNGGIKNNFRLNYSNMPEDKIVEGIKRLGAVLHEKINA